MIGFYIALFFGGAGCGQEFWQGLRRFEIDLSLC